MAQDPRTIQAKLKELHEERLTFVKAELWQLPNQLEEKETLHAIASVQDDSGKNRLLVVTSKRMFLLYQGTELEVVSYNPKEIRGCQIKKGIILSTLIFFLKNDESALKFNGMDSMHAVMIFNAVKTLLDTDSKSSTDNIITHLERLVSFRDKGILTEEEFIAQKQAILSEMPPEKKPTPQSIFPSSPCTVQPSPKEMHSPQLDTPTTHGQKKKSILSWVSTFIAIFISLASYVFFNSPHNELVSLEEITKSLQKQTEMSLQSPPLIGHPLAVRVVNYNKYEKNRRYWTEITIVPTEDQSKATQADFAATVAAVAMKGHKETDAPIVRVTMLCQKAANSSGELQLAYVVYTADGYGITGKTPGKTWEFFSAVPRGFTKNELKYLQLWAEMRQYYIDKNGLLQEDKLKVAVIQKMKLKQDGINPHQVYSQPIRSKLKIEGELKIVQPRSGE